MVCHKIALGDAQPSGHGRWGFAQHYKILGGFDDILRLARCNEFLSAHSWNASKYSYSPLNFPETSWTVPLVGKWPLQTGKTNEENYKMSILLENRTHYKMVAKKIKNRNDYEMVGQF